ncbi:MAG: hypothetical protein P1V97_09060, partial [Planctomycetota bacterium]|nr:hypothetical protein [Planctomycetota bacterium]
MRSFLPLILILMASTQGCVTANTWTSDRARIVSEPEGTYHSLVVREDLVECNLFYQGDAGVKIQKFQARKAPFFFRPTSSWDLWWAFPVTAPLDVTLFVVTSPYACVQKAVASVGERNLDSPQELKKGETIPAYLTGTATLTYTGLESPLERALYNSFKNKYGASYAFNGTAQLQRGKSMPYNQRLLITYEDMILACLEENKNEAEFLLTISGLRFRKAIPLLRLIEIHDELLDKAIGKRGTDFYLITAARRMEQNCKLKPDTPAEIKAAILAMKRRLSVILVEITTRREAEAEKLAMRQAKDAASERKKKVLRFYSGLPRAYTYYS